MKDSILRSALVSAAAPAAESFGFKRNKRKDFGGEYTRVASKEELMKWNDEREPAMTNVDMVVSDTLHKLMPKMEKLGSLLKSIIDERVPSGLPDPGRD